MYEGLFEACPSVHALRVLWVVCDLVNVKDCLKLALQLTLCVFCGLYVIW